MTEDPKKNVSGDYDLLADRGQQGISLGNNSPDTIILTPAAKTAPGKYDLLAQQGRADLSNPIKVKVRPAQNGTFAKAAATPLYPSNYDDQSLIGKFLINALLMLTGMLDPDKSGNNPLIALISKAFGMNDDSEHTQFRQLREDVRTRGRETVRAERDFSRFDRRAASDAVRMGQPVLGKNAYGSQLLEMIGSAETGGKNNPGKYNVVYGGKTIEQLHPEKKSFSQMTLNEVMAWQLKYTSIDGSVSSAAGKYQIIRKTMAGTIKEMGLTGNELFTDEMQDRMGMHLMRKRGYDKFMSGEITEAQFMRNLSKEWASLPKDRTGAGSYDGDKAGNRALVSAGHVENALSAERAGRTTSDRFAAASAGNTPPTPPATNPIIVADAPATAAPARRQSNLPSLGLNG